VSGRDNDREGGELLEALAYMLASDVLEDADELEAELAKMAGNGRNIVDGLLAEAKMKIAQQRRESLSDRDDVVVIAKAPSVYAETRGEELDRLWMARTKGLESGQVAVAHRELKGVSLHDKQTLHQDLDLLDEEESEDGGEK